MRKNSYQIFIFSLALLLSFLLTTIPAHSIIPNQPSCSIIAPPPGSTHLKDFNVTIKYQDPLGDGNNLNTCTYTVQPKAGQLSQEISAGFCGLSESKTFTRTITVGPLGLCPEQTTYADASGWFCRIYCKVSDDQGNANKNSSLFFIDFCEGKNCPPIIHNITLNPNPTTKACHSCPAPTTATAFVADQDKKDTIQLRWLNPEIGTWGPWRDFGDFDETLLFYKTGTKDIKVQARDNNGLESIVHIKPITVTCPDCFANVTSGKAKIKVMKIVINDNGGNKTPQDFKIKIMGNNPTPSWFMGTGWAMIGPGPFNVTEVQLPGYSATFAGECSGIISAGEMKICTITNNDIPSNLTLIKYVINNDGGTLQVQDFPLFINQTQVTSNQKNTLNASFYQVSETQNPGYQPLTWSGDCNPDGTITLGLNQSKTCTITNDDIRPNLTVIKHVINQHNGNKTVSDFALFVDESQVTSSVTNSFVAGSHQVSETSLPGYTSQISGDCLPNGTVILTPADNKTCIITNTDQPANLTVIKIVINDNGGNKTIQDFALFVDSLQVTSGQINQFPQGLHTVSETQLPGYNATFGADCNQTGQVDLLVGQNKTCTITNDDIPPKLIVTKIVINDNGGNKTPQDFTIHINATNPSLSTFPGNEQGTNITLDAGPYNISEDQLPDYETSFSQGCQGTISVGQTKYCNVTNNDLFIPGEIHGIKFEDKNGNGIKEQNEPLLANWIINLTGPQNSSTQTDAGGAFQFLNLTQGVYTLKETLKSGWLQTTPNPPPIQIQSATNSTNNTFGNFRLGRVFGTKFNDLNGDGIWQKGTEPPLEGWNITILRPNTTLSWNLTNQNGDYSFRNLEAGTHIISEILQPGWLQTKPTSPPTYEINVKSNSQFVNKDFGNFKLGKIIVHKDVLSHNNTNTSDNHTFTVKLNSINPKTLSEQITATYENLTAGLYTITEDPDPNYDLLSITPPQPINITSGSQVHVSILNKQKPSQLLIIKQVINNNSGTASPQNFTLHLKQNNIDVPNSPAPGSQTGTLYNLTPGTYEVSEDTPPEGYTQLGITGDCLPNGTVTLLQGQLKTCTITNDDIPNTTLKVIKIVINDNGGNKTVPDFPLFIDNISVTSEEVKQLSPGPHQISETNQAGYSQTIGGDCLPNGTVNLQLGENKVCTITNNDIPSNLTLIKRVINDNNGTKQPSNFTLRVDGIQTISGQPTIQNAGPHQASEDQQEDYIPSNWEGDCLSNGTIILGLNQSKTCTITNNDKPATLIIVKHVINDNSGTLQAQNFTIHINATNPSLSTFPGNEQGTNITLDQGPYNVTEDQNENYTTTLSPECSGTINIGEIKYCNITNDDLPQTMITIIKQVINDNGGNKTIQEFELFLNQTQVYSGQKQTVEPGLYIVSENQLEGYNKTFSGDCNENGEILLELGDNKTCIITNNDIQPKLIVTKLVINDNGQNKTSQDFTIHINATNPSPTTFPANESGTQVILNAGPYNVTEIPDSQYNTTLSQDCSGAINIGQTKHCNITNNDIEQPKANITICKIILKNTGQVQEQGNTLPPATFKINISNEQQELLHEKLFTTDQFFVDKDLLSDHPGNDAQCMTFEDLSLGTYFYSQEQIIDEENWEEPKYNDQDIFAVQDLFDFFPYSPELFDQDPSNDSQRNQDSDGQIILTSNRPNKTLVLLNRQSQKGSIRICKIIIDDQAKVITNDSCRLPQATFNITLLKGPAPNQTTLLNKLSFQTSTFDVNQDLLLSDQKDDAQCILIDNLPLQTYFYEKEIIFNESEWLEEKYNDQDIFAVQDLFDFFPYSPELFDQDPSNDSQRNQDSDGQIILTKFIPNRTLVVLNGLGVPDPPCEDPPQDWQEQSIQQDQQQIQQQNINPPQQEFSCRIEQGEYCTQTQGQWGQRCRSNNVGCLRDKNWGKVIKDYIEVGVPNTIILTSSDATRDYLLATGNPSILTKDHKNPKSTESGPLGGQLTALKLNLLFSQKGFGKITPTSTDLADLYIASGPFQSLTVQEFLTLAEQALGGNLSALPQGTTLKDLKKVAAKINKNFLDCTQDLGYLIKDPSCSQ